MKKCFLIIILLIAIQGNTRAQTPWLDSVKHVMEDTQQDTVRLMWLAGKASNFKFWQWDSTLYYGNEAVKLARKIKSPGAEANALLSMSLSQGAFGNEPQALQLCLLSINIADKNNLTYGKAWGLLQLGKIYTQSKNYAKAIESYKESISVLRSLNIRPGLTRVRMAESYMLMGELDSALYHCQMAYEGDIRSKELHGLTLLIMGRIHQKLGHTDLALDFLHRSKRGQSYQFEINYALANLYQETNNIDSCIFYANKSLENAEELGFYSNIIEASELLSNIYENSDLSKALRYNRMARAYSDSLYTMGKLASLNNLVDFDEQERRYELEAAKTSYRNQVQRIWIFSISGGLISAIVLSLVLYLNNKNKQKANAALKEQKEEIQSTLGKLESTQAQLVQSEKMASLGELTAGIAHEIQNPLNFVNNFSEVNAELTEELKDEARKGNIDGVLSIANNIHDNQQKINHHGKRADAIVKGMLQHSRSGSITNEPTDINALADEYFRLAYHGLRAKDANFNATMKTEFDETLDKVNIVPQDIGRVILNLVSNAFYAVAEKKKSTMDDYDPTVTISTSKSGGQIFVSVTDNGNGIPPSALNKIFQPFFTTKATGEGTGLGLSISYDIVTKGHGGTIKVESSPGEGTKFVIQFPLEDVT